MHNSGFACRPSIASDGDASKATFKNSCNTNDGPGQKKKKETSEVSTTSVVTSLTSVSVDLTARTRQTEPGQSHGIFSSARYEIRVGIADK